MDIAKALERIEDIKHSCDVEIAKHGEYDDLFLLDKETIETLVFAYKETKEKLKLERKTTNDLAKEISKLVEEKAQLMKENAKLNLELGKLQGNMQATKEIIEHQNELIKEYEDILYSSINKEV